jgi:hypothetical protein
VAFKGDDDGGGMVGQPLHGSFGRPPIGVPHGQLPECSERFCDKDQTRLHCVPHKLVVLILIL